MVEEDNEFLSAEDKSIDYKRATSIYDFVETDINGEEVRFDKYRGHVCLIVNIATKCGLALTNFQQLAELKSRFFEQGLRILCFPSDSFGMEPGTSEEIKTYLEDLGLDIGDVFQKTDVNGSSGCNLWKYLKRRKSGTFGSFIKWNFTKFIVDMTGKPVERHGPYTDPIELVAALEKYLPTDQEMQDMKDGGFQNDTTQ
ncbi:glutathione peroxidase-like [Ctenocephalides felis]|uniref:glutathione peroxidase-like n=1 Tax=Ctenocephalides felis TaxID=7515 RepID=UPI000E6E5A52|nr:glutathione peroxidase-like [Ctenocephalides felis]XP_026470438.1 glutathione peroxidase-like [Ctenocephalides felis]